MQLWDCRQRGGDHENTVKIKGREPSFYFPNYSTTFPASFILFFFCPSFQRFFILFSTLKKSFVSGERKKQRTSSTWGGQIHQDSLFSTLLCLSLSPVYTQNQTHTHTHCSSKKERENFVSAHKLQADLSGKVWIDRLAPNRSLCIRCVT